MSPRVTSDLLLVGSVPAASTADALRAGAANFADLVFALPDGETGPRSSWVGYERERLVRPNPAIETVAETTSPTGIPRHMYETPIFRIRPGVSEVRWDSWPRVTDAIASYQVFRELRAAGVIPRNLRFQVGLPFPVSALNGLRADFAADYPVAMRGYQDLVAREVERLVTAVPRKTWRSSGTSPTRPSTSRGSCRGPPQAHGTASPKRLTGCPGSFLARCSSGTTCATARSPSGRCTRRGTWAYSSGWRTTRSPAPAGPPTGCTWPGRATCAARTTGSSDRSRPSGRGRPRLPRDRAAAGRRARPAAAPGDRVEVPA